MKKALKVLGWILASIVAHEVSFPIPFPLTDAEIAALGAERSAAGAAADEPLAGVDLEAVALERAVARGERLIKARLGCDGCHGADFSGHVLIDDPMVGHWVAPNLTTGKGGAAARFTASDWDHAVRHGLRAGGRRPGQHEAWADPQSHAGVWQARLAGRRD